MEVNGSTLDRGGLFQEAVGNFARRPAADGGNAGDRQEVFHHRMGCFRICAFKGRQESEPDIASVVARLVRTGHAADGGRQLVGFAEEIAQAALPDGRKVKPAQDGGEKRFVADENVAVPDVENVESCDRKAEHVRVRFVPVVPAEAFRAQLRDFPAALGPLPEHRSRITVVGAPSGIAAFQVLTANRNGEIRTQAIIFAALAEGVVFIAIFLGKSGM
mgnify:CR=1 FL=1